MYVTLKLVVFQGESGLPGNDGVPGVDGVPGRRGWPGSRVRGREWGVV